MGKYKSVISGVEFEQGEVPVWDVEMSYITTVLKKFNGNRIRAARSLGVSPSTLKNRISSMVVMGYDVPKATIGGVRKGEDDVEDCEELEG